MLGDLFLDRYLDIDPARDEPSCRDRPDRVPGGRASAATPGRRARSSTTSRRWASAAICPIAVIGDDGEGYELRQALKRCPRWITAGIFSVPGPPHADVHEADVRHRGAEPPRHQEPHADAGRGAGRASSSCSTRRGRRLDALLVLDQVSEEDCGVVTKRVRDHLAELGERDPGKFVLADSRERIGSSGTCA